jgi:hypothetical protein
VLLLRGKLFLQKCILPLKFLKLVLRLVLGMLLPLVLGMLLPLVLGMPLCLMLGFLQLPNRRIGQHLGA